jgi:hypothetical protein
LLLWLVAQVATATSYTMISDAALADQAEVIVQATVLAKEPAPIAAPPSTDYFVQVEQLVKGYVAGSTVVIRVLGGIGPDGIGLRVWGTPVFHQGERVILFLAPRPDGTYGILHLMLGAFHEVPNKGERLAVRDLTETIEVVPEWGLLDQGPMLALDPPREFESFVEWLTDRVAGRQTEADYFRPEVTAPDLPSEPSRAPLLEDPCTHLGFRSFEVDRGRPVKWQVDLRGFDGKGSGRRAFARSRKAWAETEAGALRLTDAGPTAVAAGLSSQDGRNSLLFNDPRQQIEGVYRCSSGGVLAIAGIWYDSGRGQDCRLVNLGEKGRFRGQQFLKILSADIVTNEGSACFFRKNPTGTSEVLTHELGHTLGLSHTPVVEAIMFGPVRDDERGAALHAADQSALALIYGATR